MVTQNMWRTHEGKLTFSERKICFVNLSILIRSNNRHCSVRAHLFSELPSNTSTMSPTKWLSRAGRRRPCAPPPVAPPPRWQDRYTPLLLLLGSPGVDISLEPVQHFLQVIPTKIWRLVQIIKVPAFSTDPDTRELKLSRCSVITGVVVSLSSMQTFPNLCQRSDASTWNCSEP